MLTGAIGLDVQPSHSVVVEWDGTTPGAFRPIGDGVRRAVPHALGAKGAWASAAVPPSVLPAEVGSLAELMPWRVDPWSVPFLRGLADRLGRYIGLPAATHRHGYHLWVVGDDSAERRAALDAAGLADVTFVDPADAALAEWLSGGARGVPADHAFQGHVVAVACGEESTVVDAFRVDGRTRPRIVRVPAARRHIPSGIGPVTLRVVTELLRRRVRHDRPVNVPALLGAVAEYGQIVAATADGARGGVPQPVEWDGPLAELLPTPFALRQADIDDFPETRALVRQLRAALADANVLAGDDEDAVVVLGGPGAGWGSLRAAADGARAVTVSADPEQSLAAGACSWSLARRLTRDVWSEPAEPDPVAAAGVPTPRVAAASDLPQQRPDRRLPPWMTNPATARRAWT